MSREKTARLWCGLHLVSGVVLAIVMALPGTVIGAEAGDYPAIGPLPAKSMPDAGKAAMGKRLFFDARMSGDGAVSCATCHDPAEGFTKTTDIDGSLKRLSDGYPGTPYFRNAPTLINVRYKEDFADVGWTWEGRMGANLNDVMRDQLTETTIMNMDMRLMHERMKQDPVYVQMCADNFGGECSSSKARKALVAFVETLVSDDAPFDTRDMDSAAKRGRKLFAGRGGCIRCHNGPYFSDGKPHNTGVPENLEIFNDPMRHLTYRAVIASYGVPKMEIWRRDVGYFIVSKQYGDVGKFITPTLRELKYTAPYMHNGVIDSLEDVVEFYNRGGGPDDPLATELAPLDLSRKERQDLVAFLESLSSITPVTVERESVPQEYQVIENWLEVKN